MAGIQAEDQTKSHMYRVAYCECIRIREREITWCLLSETTQRRYILPLLAIFSRTSNLRTLYILRQLCNNNEKEPQELINLHRYTSQHNQTLMLARTTWEHWQRTIIIRLPDIRLWSWSLHKSIHCCDSDRSHLFLPIPLPQSATRSSSKVQVTLPPGPIQVGSETVYLHLLCDL